MKTLANYWPLILAAAGVALAAIQTYRIRALEKTCAHPPGNAVSERSLLSRDLSEMFSEVMGLFLMFAGVIGFSLILFAGFKAEAERKSEEWTSSLPHAARVDAPPSSAVRMAMSPGERRFAEQLDQAAARAHAHLTVMKYFYSRYYAAVTIAALLAIAAAACLVHIGAVGWTASNKYIASIFIATAALAILFKAVPLLYKQEDNIAANKLLYTQYVGLHNEMLSYQAIRTFRDSLNVPINEVVVKVDSALYALRELPIGFDRSHIPDYAKTKFLE